MPVIFISYRRDDQPGFAGRLADALEGVFGADIVFRDREDIHPGDDFVAAIDRELREAGVVLVVIGPQWLSTSHEGKRRLEEPGDFVAMEVRRAIASGKPLLPILVGGAAMPGESDLPRGLKPLARRQAIVLSDGAWAADLSRLIETLRQLLPAPRRRRRALAIAAIALVLTLSAALALQTFWLQPAAQRERAQVFAGRWLAQVRYDWGDTYEETFELRVKDGEVSGTASFLRVARLIEEGKINGKRIDFTTHSIETLGNGPPRTVAHRYRGRAEAGALDMVLETGGSDSPHPPVSFVARRADKSLSVLPEDRS